MNEPVKNSVSLEKSLIIRGPLEDLGDVLAIARANGKKVLRVDKVRVKPYIVSYGVNDYLVVVEPDVGSGCSKSPGVGEREKHVG